MLRHHALRHGQVSLLALLTLGTAALSSPAAAREPPGALRPLPWLDGHCDDPRYPRLSGDWAVGCGPSGAVDRAQHLESGARATLLEPARSPAIGPGGEVVAPGLPTARWRLAEGLVAPERLPAIPGFEGDGALATDGETLALRLDDEVQRVALGEPLRHHLGGAPAPWYALAVDGEHTAWVSLEEGGSAVWLRSGDAPARELDGEQHPRHVAASGGYLGWIRDDGVVVMDLASGERARYPADAHTSRRLSLQGPVACWEQWNGEDVDVACSDGVTAGGPGHQRNPSRGGGWLLFVQDGRTRVIALQ